MFSEGRHTSPVVDQRPALLNREEILLRYQAAEFRSVLLATREAPADFRIEQMKEKDQVAAEMASKLSENISEKNKRIIQEFLEWRKNDRPRFRIARGNIDRFLSGEISSYTRADKTTLSLEDAQQIADGLLIDQRRQDRETFKTLRPHFFGDFKNPFVVQETEKLDLFKKRQIAMIVMSCLEDVSYYGITTGKAFGVSAKEIGKMSGDHRGFELFDDNSENTETLLQHFFDKIPPAERCQLKRDGMVDPNELQILPHPTSATKVILRFQSSYPGGVNKFDASSDGSMSNGSYETRGGTYASVIVLSKSSVLVKGLREGKFFNLLNPILRTLAAELDRNTLPVVDGIMCRPEDPWVIQDRVGKMNSIVNKDGVVQTMASDYFAKKRKTGETEQMQVSNHGIKIKDDPYFKNHSLKDLGYRDRD